MICSCCGKDLVYMGPPIAHFAFSIHFVEKETGEPHGMSFKRPVLIVPCRDGDAIWMTDQIFNN